MDHATDLRHNAAMAGKYDASLFHLVAGPLRLTLEEAKRLRDVAFNTDNVIGDAPLLSASEKLDALIVALDERASTLPPPPQPAKLTHDPYCAPWMVALRNAPGASVCCDPDCSLSGDRAHVGPCEPCGCAMNHAIEECPDLRQDVCTGCKGRGFVVCGSCAGRGTQ